MEKQIKPYQKPVLVRYGRVEDLTKSGTGGANMDHLAMGTKTGF